MSGHSSGTCCYCLEERGSGDKLAAVERERDVLRKALETIEAFEKYFEMKEPETDQACGNYESIIDYARNVLATLPPWQRSADVQALVEAAREILKYGYVLHTNDKHTGDPLSSPKCETCALAAALKPFEGQP